MDWLTWLYHHPKEVAAAFAAALVAWTPVATVLARFIPRPPPAASWWKRALFDLFVDTPAWAAALGRSGVFGGVFNVPGIPSRTPTDNPTPAASKMMRIARMSDETGRVHPPRRPGEGPLIALLIASALTMALAALAAGCASMKELGRCELNTFPQQLEKLIAKVVIAAFIPGEDWEDMLKQAALEAAPGQVSCIAQSVQKMVEEEVTTGERKGQKDSRFLGARYRMFTYVQKHPPTSCAPVPRKMLLARVPGPGT